MRYSTPRQQTDHPHPRGLCADRWSVAVDVDAVGTFVLDDGSSLDPAGAVAARVAVPDALQVRSERLLMEELDYDLLFGWFFG